MEASKTLHKIKKLKPNKSIDESKEDDTKKDDKLYKMICSMYEKNYNLKIYKKKQL